MDKIRRYLLFLLKKVCSELRKGQTGKKNGMITIKRYRVTVNRQTVTTSGIYQGENRAINQMLNNLPYLIEYPLLIIRNLYIVFSTWFDTSSGTTIRMFHVCQTILTITVIVSEFIVGRTFEKLKERGKDIAFTWAA